MTYRRSVKRSTTPPLKSKIDIHAPWILKRKNNQPVNLFKSQKENIKKSGGWLTSLSQIIANISQFLMLFLVAWGYFYTVLPAMQKEQLAEELAKLELEKKAWDAKISSVSRQLHHKENELQNLKKTKATLLSDIITLTDERDGLNHRLDVVQKEYNHVELKLLRSKESIENATRDLLVKYKQDLLGENKLSDYFVTIYNNSLTGGPFLNGTINDLSKNLEKDYPKPIESAQRTLSSIGESITYSSGADKVAKKRLYNEYKNGMFKKHYLLLCPTPNYDAWAAAFTKFNSTANSLNNFCVERTFDHLAHDKISPRDTIDTMRKNDSLRHQEIAYRNDCKLRLDFELKRVFRDEWDKIKEPCEQRLMKVNDVILNDDVSIELKPFLDISAPTKEFITSKLENSLSKR